MSLKLFTLLLCLNGISTFGSIYDLHITTIDGLDKPMSDFQGKKLLIIILPVSTTAADSLYLHTVDSMSRKYSDSVAIIGVPAFEYGYQSGALAALQQYYRGTIGPQVFLTRGLYVKKASGGHQHPLFSWLTHAAQNNQFDQEVKGVGQKYFINSNGELYGVLSSAVTLCDSLMLKMLY